jgi:hypothetical protein
MWVKRVLSCLALASLVITLVDVAGCQSTVTGSGELATWNMAFTDFNRLEISSAFDVAVTRADAYSVSITIDEMLYSYLEVDQRGDTLRIGLKPSYAYIDTTQRAVVNLPDLTRLELSDASIVTVSGFSMSHGLDFELRNASELELGHTISGNCNFTLSDSSRVTGILEMDDGEFRLNDSSDLELEGSADNIKIDGASSSDFILEDFAVLTADIELSAASHAVVNVSNRMDVNLSAASELEYIGSPLLGNLDMSADSELNQRQH